MQAAAVIVRGPSGRSFVRAEKAHQIVPQPTISRVPYSELGMALVGGRVVSVVEIAASSGALLLCEYEGEAMGISGLVIERVGFFELSSEGARVDDVVLPELVPEQVLRHALGEETDGFWHEPE